MPKPANSQKQAGQPPKAWVKGGVTTSPSTVPALENAYMVDSALPRAFGVTHLHQVHTVSYTG